MKIINPATEEVIADIDKDTRKSVQKKYHAALTAQPAWAATTIEHRIQCIQRFYDLLDTNRDELAGALTSEVGKPLQQSYNELNGARSRIKKVFTRFCFSDHYLETILRNAGRM